MDIKAFWSRVKIQIKAKGVTQAVAARACNVPPNTFRGWMAGDRVPPLSYAYKLSRYLGVSLEYLIEGRKLNNTSRNNKTVLDLLKKASKKLSLSTK